MIPIGAFSLVIRRGGHWPGARAGEKWLRGDEIEVETEIEIESNGGEAAGPQFS